MKAPILLIDTDPGIDDALALALALACDEVDLRYVTTVAGNASVRTVTRNAGLLLELLNAPADLRFSRGAARPLAGKHRDAGHFHGTDGLGGVADWLASKLGKPRRPAGSAVATIVAAAREHGGDLSIIALGPLTNIALALREAPDALRTIGGLVVMGGALRTPGNVTPLAEFNLYADAQAAAEVLGADLPVLLVPLDVTHQVWLSPAHLRTALHGRRDPLATALRRMSAHAFKRQPRGYALHDPLAVALAMRPELVQTETVPVTVLSGSPFIDGATIEDRRPAASTPPQGHPVKCALRVDATGMLRLFSQRVLESPRTAARSRVLVVGGINMDYVVPTPRLPVAGETVTGKGLDLYAGGKGANQAVAARRAGAEVTLIARVGDDDDGRTLGSDLQAEGIELTPTGTATARTGVALICVDDSGHNQIVVAPGANTQLAVDDVHGAAKAFERAAVVLCQFETPMASTLAALELARRHGTLTMLNPSPVRAVPGALPPLVDVLIVNEIEAEAFTGFACGSRRAAQQALPLLRAQGFASVVVTLGALGVVWSGASGAGSVPAERVRAVDTTAAGDTFAGYLAASMASGHTLEDAVRRANRAAASCVTARGAQPSIPSTVR